MGFCFFTRTLLSFSSLSSIGSEHTFSTKKEDRGKPEKPPRIQGISSTSSLTRNSKFLENLFRLQNELSDNFSASPFVLRDSLETAISKVESFNP